MLAGVDPSTTPIGPWCDATWAEYVGFVLDASSAGGKPVIESIDETWTQMAPSPTAAAVASAAPSPRAPRATAPPPTANVETDPETGAPPRPTEAQKQAWIAQTAAMNDLSGLMGESLGTDGRSGGAARTAR